MWHTVVVEYPVVMIDNNDQMINVAASIVFRYLGFSSGPSSADKMTTGFTTPSGTELCVLDPEDDIEDSIDNDDADALASSQVHLNQEQNVHLNQSQNGSSPSRREWFISISNKMFISIDLRMAHLHQEENGLLQFFCER
ncbi:unnamed protein product [Rotaria socialis]|uniref:Uncharacterized protein n=1 Tax=Rotaria socialis TaxID=392032 RepID=A0A820XHH7_9BILA|nr:unnamed protein product [Rotaria socialis]CAF4531364.1 unnamed protein product [Rotaria socialis]